MKFIRSLPLMWANTRCPFSSSTANIVFGSGSMTVPSTSIASFLATGVVVPFLVSNAGQGTGTRTCSLSNRRRCGNPGVSDGGQDLCAAVRDGDGVLEMGRQRPVCGDEG